MPRLYLKRAPVAAMICAITTAACASPTKDYDDFRGRVANSYDAGPDTLVVDTAPEVARDGSIFDDGGVDAFSGTYWGACLESTYAGDLSKVTYDVMVVTLVKAADGSVSLSGTRSALLSSASNVSQTVGQVVTIPPTPVDANGSFAAHVATFIEPKEANGFGLDLTVENGVYAFTFMSTDFSCGHFTGKVTAPLANPVDETCVVRKPAADGSFPRFTNANDLHCP